MTQYKNINKIKVHILV